MSRLLLSCMTWHVVHGGVTGWRLQSPGCQQVLLPPLQHLPGPQLLLQSPLPVGAPPALLATQTATWGPSAGCGRTARQQHPAVSGGRHVEHCGSYGVDAFSLNTTDMHAKVEIVAPLTALVGSNIAAAGLQQVSEPICACVAGTGMPSSSRTSMLSAARTAGCLRCTPVLISLGVACHALLVLQGHCTQHEHHAGVASCQHSTATVSVEDCSPQQWQWL